MSTNDEFKDRQLHIEDYLCIIPAEWGRKAGASVHQRIAGGDIITGFWSNNLLELIIRKDNLNKAYLQVKRNKVTGGIYGMQVDELLPYLKEHQSELIQQLRKLGILTVVERKVQQAIAQELTPLYEARFSDNSYGFRPGKRSTRCPQAVTETCE